MSRKFVLTSLFSALLAALSSQASADLIVTGVFDGPLTGGEPKVVELYATADIANLSLYAVGAANNGGGTDGVENILSGSASKGDFIYIVDDNTGDNALGVNFASYFGFSPTLIFDSNAGTAGGAAAVNGDDAVEVFYEAAGDFVAGSPVVIDVFGQISGVASTGGWGYTDGWAYRNDGTGPDGSTFALGNWTFSGADVNDGKATNVDPSAFPIGSYTAIPEPGTLALAGLGLLGVVASRRRR